MNEQDDLIGDLIAEVARSHGVAISRDDPIVAVVLLNQIVLRRYLEETVAPAADAMRDATNDAVRQIEQFAEGQATWLEQVSLKDRASFLAEQKTLHNARKANVAALIQGQNTALRQAVIQTAASLRARTPPTESRSTTVQPQSVSLRTAPERNFPWAWIAVGILVGIGATMAASCLQSLGP